MTNSGLLMKAYLTRRYRFSAAHRLHNDGLSAAENLRLFGKCNNPYGHGHNYVLEVTVGGSVDPTTGMIFDLGLLDGIVEREVLARFDHENLNTLEDFRGKVPSSELLAERIFDLLQSNFERISQQEQRPQGAMDRAPGDIRGSPDQAARLEKVRLEETSQNSFEYAGGREVRR